MHNPRSCVVLVCNQADRKVPRRVFPNFNSNLKVRILFFLLQKRKTESVNITFLTNVSKTFINSIFLNPFFEKCFEPSVLPKRHAK